jgi:predicted esterase
MNTRLLIAQIGLFIMGVVVSLLSIVGCTAGKAPEPTPTTVPPTTAPAPLPTLSIDQTSVKEFVISDFDAVHAPVNGDTNQYLILGNLPVSKPAADLPAELAVYLGRWEGYSYYPPVKKDRKVVLIIQEITTQGGKAVGWSGTNLQYPEVVGELHFRVLPGDPPSIEWQILWPDGNKQIDTYTYDRDKGILRGESKVLTKNLTIGPYEFTRGRSFYVYKDYARYLASKRISSRPYQNSELQRYGQGYLLYLPEGYEDHPEKTWPLIFFLHGYGDRGDNVYLLAKASPFMFIREKGPLPFIIAAPLLNTFEGYSSFPETYMDGALAELQANYRVDAKRIYVTGLSMGGEATYRFAIHQHKTFAAIAPLSAYVDSKTYSMLERIKDLPVWVIHGAEDIVFPLARAQQPVDALKKAGGNVKFTVLAGHDHDTWTDTYSDPAFYDWLLQNQRP